MRFVIVCLLLLTPDLLLAEASKEEIPTVSELTEGILAFNCYEKADDFFPIILTEDTNGWTAIGTPEFDDIREVDNGFAFKSSAEDLVLAFLKDEGKNWQLEYFDEDGLNAAKCLEADEFAESIIEVIAPKIFDNANSLSSQLKLTQQELADEIARGKKREAELVSRVNRGRQKLADEVARGEQALADEVSFREEKVKELQSELVLIKKLADNQYSTLERQLSRVSANMSYEKLSTAVMGGESELVGLFLEQASVLKTTERVRLISQRFNGLKEGGSLAVSCFNQLSYAPTAFHSACKEMFIQHWLKK